MEAEGTSKFEHDTANIIGNEKNDNRWREFMYKMKTRPQWLTLPVVLSLMALLISIFTCVGLSIRLYEVTNTLQQGGPSHARFGHRNHAGPGSTYVHWGRKSCSGDDAETVYSGKTTGSHGVRESFGGGGVNYLCLHPSPEYNKVDKKNDSSAHSWLYSTEYLTYDLGIFDDKVHAHDVPCSVCYVHRAAKMMIPGRRTCEYGWKKEYEGYLMTSYAQENKATFECIDSNPEYFKGTRNLTDASTLYFVSSYCGLWGGLNDYCPPYEDAKELTCVICTK